MVLVSSVNALSILAASSSSMVKAGQLDCECSVPGLGGRQPRTITDRPNPELLGEVVENYPIDRLVTPEKVPT